MGRPGKSKEAHAHQKPVIASNVTSIPELAAPGSLLFDPEKGEELTHCIIKQIDRQNNHKSAIDFSKWLENFTWDLCSEKTFKYYENILHLDTKVSR